MAIKSATAGYLAGKAVGALKNKLTNQPTKPISQIPSSPGQKATQQPTAPVPTPIPKLAPGQAFKTMQGLKKPIDRTPKIPREAPEKVTPPKIPPAPGTEVPDKKTEPKEPTDVAIDEAVGDVPTPTDVPTTGAPAPTDEVKDQVEEDAAGVIAAQEGLKATYEESLDVTTKTAEDRYNAEMAAYNESLALQQQLAAQQQALLAEGAEIQKQEAKNAYDANQAAITLQKKKVAEAYEAMQEEQKLLNTQRQIREETSLGLIYGGFGSVAANKNLEETVIRGERELMGLRKEAINKDTEFQNQVVALNSAYELDIRKIEQWKGEESNKIYSSLSQYVQEIKNNKAMSAVERSSAINQAVADYNVKVAEISASVAQTKYDLSIELMNRADTLKQQDIQNQLDAAQEKRDVESFEYEQKRTVINDARTDLDLLLTNYFKEDYDTLPPDVLAEIDRLEKEAGLPSGASQQLMQMAKESEIKQGDVTKEFTNELTGEVSVVKYNFGTGKVETMKLGALEAPKSQWEMKYNPNTGQPEFYNSQTNEFMSSSSFTGTLPTEFGEGTVGGWCGVYASKISTAPQVGNSWAEKKSKITHKDDPGIGDKLVFDSSSKTDGSGYGHVAVVIGFNPSTGRIDVVESNADGRQNRGEGQGIVTKGSYFLNDILAKNGGFVAGSLREPYNSALMKANGAIEGGSEADYYIELQKTYGSAYAQKRIKDDIVDTKQQAALLKQLGLAAETPERESILPEGAENLPYIGGMLEEKYGKKPSIVEQEQKSKGGLNFEDL